MQGYSGTREPQELMQIIEADIPKPEEAQEELVGMPKASAIGLLVLIIWLLSWTSAGLEDAVLPAKTSGYDYLRTLLPQRTNKKVKCLTIIPFCYEITKIKLGISLLNVYLVFSVLGKKSDHGQVPLCITTRSLVHTV